MEDKRITPDDFRKHEEASMKQTIDQLRSNAKVHKKTIDKLSAKVSQLTQNLDTSERERMFLVSQLNEATAMIMRSAAHDGIEYQKEQSELSKALCFIVICFGAGFFSGLGWLFIDMVIRATMK